MKLEVFIIGGQRIDQKSKKGWRGNEEREKREDIEREQREDRDREKRERDKKGVEMTI